MTESLHALPRSSRLTPRQISILLIILILGAFIRFYQISAPSLWLDEIWSIEMARGQGSQHDQLTDGYIRTDQPDLTSLATAAPWWKIWSHLQLIIHPPLYFLLLRWWMDLFGNTAAATRSLSAITSLIGIAVFFDVCRLLHGTRIALIAAALMMLAIAQIDIGQEARSYPQLILLGLCCCDALVRIELFGSSLRRLFLLIAFLVGFMLTHYFCAGAVAALSLYALIRLRGRNRIRAIAAIFVAGIITLAAWGWQFRIQMRTFPDFSPGFMRETARQHVLLHTLARIFRLPLEYLFGEEPGHNIHMAIHVMAAGVLIFSIARLRAKPNLLLWILWIACIVGWATVTDLAHHLRVLDILRYTILASPGIYALIAAIEFPELGTLRRVLPYGVIAILAVTVGMRLREGVPANMDFRELSEYIDSNAKPNDLLLYYYPSPYIAPGIWYMCCKYYSPQSHAWITLRKPPDAALMALFDQRPAIWIIGLHPETEAPDVLPGWQMQRQFSNTAGGVCEMKRPAFPAVH